MTRFPVDKLTGPAGEELVAYLILPADPLRIFLRACLAGDPEAWPWSTQHQSWGPYVEDEAAFRLWFDSRFDVFPAEVFVLCLKGTDEPVATASLMVTDMSTAFDPTLPTWLGELTPWRSCVAEHPDHGGKRYAAMIGSIVLRRAKTLGLKAIHLFVSLPDDGQVPTIWRGYPCELVWRGRYCDRIPLANGSSRTNLPDEIVLSIDLANVSDEPINPTPTP